MHLNDQKVRGLPLEETGQRDYADDTLRGHFLRVGTRTKTFMVVIRTPNGRKRIKLGTYPDLLLGSAREKARDLLAENRLKKDEPPRTTFAEAFDTYSGTHLAKLRLSTSTQQARLIRRHFLQRLGKRTLSDITARDVAPIVDAIRKSAECRAAFVAVSIFFNWCAKRSYLDVSPIARLDAPKKGEPRSRVLTPDELVAVWQALPDDDYGRLCRLLILTGQRAGQWARVRAEYIVDDIITWPGSVMKSGKAHSLPLTRQVLALLPKDRVGLLFPTARGTPFSDWFRGKQQVYKASGVTGFTHHDFRRTWATIAAEELDIQPHIIESVLAHSTGTAVSRVYNRARYLEPMRKALLAFEEWLHSQLSKSEVTNAKQRP